MDSPKLNGKPYAISKELVVKAYRKVKANRGAAGVDGVEIEEFEKDLKNNLYRIWNRMSSGSYHPPAVRTVEIPKSHGDGVRLLGVPTVSDRVAQTVAAMTLEATVERTFHPDSYGYRPRRSALDAVAMCRKRCGKRDWVIDLDIQNFFGSLDHALVVKAVEANLRPGQEWVLLYVRRWLVAPVQHPDGTREVPDRGTPQGSAISPVLANLFLHYAFDTWLAKEFPAVAFERYADDAVVHCATRRQAEHVRDAISQRMAEVGLRLHPAKTKIVYCQDTARRGSHEHTSFTFLGYAFRQRKMHNPRTNELFTSFTPAISADALKAKGAEARTWRLHRRVSWTLDSLADAINPIVRGWMTYWGRFNRHEMHHLLTRINAYLLRWARRKYRRLWSYKRAKAWWLALVQRAPELFAHWTWTTAYLGRIR